jgi:hypothetical protein
MKKILSFTLLMIIVLGSSFGLNVYGKAPIELVDIGDGGGSTTTDPNALTYNETIARDYYQNFGLGSTINLYKVDNNGKNIMYGDEEVLKNDFIQSQFESGNLSISNYNLDNSCSEYVGINHTDNLASTKLEYREKLIAPYFIDGFNGLINIGFNSTFSESLSSTESEYLYTKSCNDVYMKLGFENDYLNRDLYINNLSDAYINALIDLNNKDKVAYFNFFDNVGTHLITEMSVGKKIELYYQEKFYTSELNLEFTQEMYSDVSLKFWFQKLADINQNIENVSTFMSATNTSGYAFSLNVSGGNGKDLSSKNTFESNFTSWYEDRNLREAAVIDYNYEKMIPLFELIPSESVNSVFNDNFKTKFGEMYALYMLEKNDIFVTYDYVDQINYPDSFIPNFNMFDQLDRGFLVRNETYLIDDDCLYYSCENITGVGNEYDVIDISQLTGVSLLDFYYYGYQYITIEFSISAREKYDGYQYVIFTSSLYDNNNAYVYVEENRFEFELTNNLTRILEDTINLEIDYLKEASIIYITYDAAGAFSDDWYNYELYVKVSIHKGE